jgi:hypothetical protein
MCRGIHAHPFLPIDEISSIETNASYPDRAHLLDAILSIGEISSIDSNG